jgi:16S rRNA (adenine1518-N6/adenine1519-N6)-dimethyltransferase
VLGLIISAAELSPEDIVIEVGPGLGVVTRELAPRVARLIAVELDDKLALFLKQKLASWDNVSVINRDILEVEPRTLLHGGQGGLPSAPGGLLRYKVVANLPYYITSPVLRYFLEATLKPSLMVVMVQKEVAEAITAEPGRMSVLSVSVQYYGSFYPEPEIDSAVLRIVTYAEPVVSVDSSDFFRLVRGGFTASRKQLANSLAQGLALPKGEVLSLLAEVGIDSHRRAETLTLEEWAALWRITSRQEKGE